MTMFRKLPVVVEAFQFSGSEIDGPAWAVEAVDYGVIRFDAGSAVVKTLNGDLTAGPGDWIVRGAEGEIYPVKGDIFAATYEVA
ncbi:hypothetical protein G8E10_09545 [Rhizobiaceae bacterium CRRU44]|uniref:Uncharacterized protein n=1 Tax=Ferranicluibacter rubi TaxID=2715133 RepID=A0AA43ZFH4_9HYPH|nr:hypothetical protein [Ferranicluibacter rubi]NHT75922.1 hypothetical protein [Ferranicluibacter rubi]NHT75982.1 hypothetical protein [Ferranicluibacter rubi]